MSRNLASLTAQAAEALCVAGCTPLARVRAAAGVVDLIFLTTYGARLLVRCSTKKSSAPDLKALTTMHQQRAFDHVVLLHGQSQNRADPPTVVTPSELSNRAIDLARTMPGWAI